VNPAVAHFAHQIAFKPAEALFDPLPLLLTDCVSGVARGPLVDCAAAGTLYVLYY
jgi:hypothetical protein